MPKKPPVDPVHGKQRQERKCEQHRGVDMGRSVIERFDGVVDGKRHDAGLSLDVPADHKDDAELADRMGKR